MPDSFRDLTLKDLEHIETNEGPQIEPFELKGMKNYPGTELSV